MNFFPGIYQPKRTKKATSFSNPITGTFYSNKDFLKNCRNVPRSISQLDHIKQIKYQINNEESFGIKKNNGQKKKSITRLEERKKMERQIIAIHVTNKLSEPLHKSFHQSTLINKKCRKAFDNDTLRQIQRTNLNKTFLSNNSQKDERRSQEFIREDKLMKAKSSVVHESVSFNDIEILVLDLLTQKEDFRTKIVRINLQKYFRSFFKKQLSGHFTQQFLDKVEYYINQLLQKQKIDEVIDQQQYPVDLFTISSRIIFMNKILEFQARKSSTNQDNIRTMIKFYCVPSKQFRQSCLRDIILMLTLEIYEKFNCSRQNQYILIDQDGNQIQEILQIKFSTKKLFLTSKKNAAKNFNNYLTLLDQFYREGKKLSFTQNIKLNFRQKLAQGKYDDGHFNYTENYQIHKLQRLIQLENAQNILKKRTDTHRVNKFTPKQETNSFYHQTYKKSQDSQLPTQNQTNLSTLNQFASKSKLENQNQFWKSSDQKISSQMTNKRSFSPLRQKSPTRTQSPIKNQTNLQKQKLQQLLKDDKKRTLNAQTEKKFKLQFRDFVSKNDIVDFKFNHHFRNRVLKQVLKIHFVYFLDKNDSQINKIIQSVKFINNQNINCANDQTLLLQDSIKEKQSITGEEKKNDELGRQEKQKYIENSLDWQEFRNLKTIVSCAQPKQVIMIFVANYLGFNEFGQISKANLFKQIQFILQGKCDQPTAQVIVDVIWSWFQSNSIIENGFIRRMTLQSWFQKYKIVYFMLISLIFGSNHKTVLDLAYQVLT